MLQKIKKSKYPAISAEEEAVSIPLQTLCQAIFDAILVHIVNTVSAGGKWQQLQQHGNVARRSNESVELSPAHSW